MYVIDGMDVSSDAVMAIEALFLLISSEGSLQRDSYSSRKVCFCTIYFLSNHNMCSFTFRHLKKFSLIQVLKECLLCVVQLCRVHPRTSDQFVDIVGGLLLTTSRETVSWHTLYFLVKSQCTGFIFSHLTNFLFCPPGTFTM